MSCSELTLQLLMIIHDIFRALTLLITASHIPSNYHTEALKNEAHVNLACLMCYFTPPVHLSQYTMCSLAC